VPVVVAVQRGRLIEPDIPIEGIPPPARLAAIFGLLVAATVLLVAGATTLVARTQLTRNLDTELRGTAESFQLGPAAHAAGEADLATAAHRWLAEHPLPVGQMAAIRIGHNTVLASAGNLDMFEVPSPRALLTSTRTTWWNLHGTEGAVRGLTVPIRTRHGQAGTLVLLAYRRPLDHTLGALLGAIADTSIAGIAAALLLGGLIVARSLRPLRAMTAELATIETTRDLTRPPRPRRRTRRTRRARERLRPNAGTAPTGLRWSATLPRRRLSRASHPTDGRARPTRASRRPAR
jgi:hypothetical protein